jgi:hypothetical protein
VIRGREETTGASESRVQRFCKERADQFQARAFQAKGDIKERQGASRSVKERQERERVRTQDSGLRTQESGIRGSSRRISGQPGHINCCFRPISAFYFHPSKLLCRRLALNRSLTFILHSSPQ